MMRRKFKASPLPVPSMNMPSALPSFFLAKSVLYFVFVADPILNKNYHLLFVCFMTCLAVGSTFLGITLKTILKNI